MTNPLTFDTSIQPQGVYPGGFTRQAGNLAAAQATPAYPDLAAANAMPGISITSPMTQYAMGAQYGQSMAGAQMAQPQTAWAHGLVNAQNQLGGQVARDQEALGWGGLAAQNQAAAQQMDLFGQGNLLRLLASMYNQWW